LCGSTRHWRPVSPGRQPGRASPPLGRFARADEKTVERTVPPHAYRGGGDKLYAPVSLHLPPGREASEQLPVENSMTSARRGPCAASDCVWTSHACRRIAFTAGCRARKEERQGQISTTPSDHPRRARMPIARIPLPFARRYVRKSIKRIVPHYWMLNRSGCAVVICRAINGVGHLRG